jgi:adenylate kinase
VPDQLVLDMLREAMAAAKAAGGGLSWTGIPRNMRQARAVYLMGRELGMTADVALHLQAGDAELTRRLLARAAIEHRSDDTADVIAQRLALYYEVTSPILSWYRDRGILVSVDAMHSAHQVGREILTALEVMRPLLEHVPTQARHPVDLTGLEDAFGAAGSTAGAPDLADLLRCPPVLNPDPRSGGLRIAGVPGRRLGGGRGAGEGGPAASGSSPLAPGAAQSGQARHRASQGRPAGPF